MERLFKESWEKDGGGGASSIIVRYVDSDMVFIRLICLKLLSSITVHEIARCLVDTILSML